MIEKRLRAGDLRNTGQNEQQREKRAADNRNDRDRHGVLLDPLSDVLTGCAGLNEDRWDKWCRQIRAIGFSGARGAW
jgi:hypothetical protein